MKTENEMVWRNNRLGF